MNYNKARYNFARMNDSQADFWQGLVKIFTDPAFLSAVSSVILIMLATLSQNFKNWVNQLIKKWEAAKELRRAEKHVIPHNYLPQSLGINARISKLRESLDCSRVAILQFRNGSMFTLSSPMFRVYSSFESLRPGVKPSADCFKEKLGTTILELLAPILGAQPTLVAGTKLVDHAAHPRPHQCPIPGCCPRVVQYNADELPYCTLKFMMEEAGVSRMYCVPLKSNNNTIGILAIHYLINVDTVDKIEENLHEICDTVQRVQAALDLRQQNA